MFILRRLLPWVVKVLCYLAVNQLCNSSEMFCILHWDNLEWSCCTLKCTWSCMNHKFSLVSNFNSDKWWKKLAMGQLHFGTFLHKWVVFWWESFSGIQYVWQIFESETIAFTPLLKWFHLFLYLKKFFNSAETILNTVHNWDTVYFSVNGNFLFLWLCVYFLWVSVFFKCVSMQSNKTLVAVLCYSNLILFPKTQLFFFLQSPSTLIAFNCILSNWPSPS